MMLKIKMQMKIEIDTVLDLLKSAIREVKVPFCIKCSSDSPNFVSPESQRSGRLLSLGNIFKQILLLK